MNKDAYFYPEMPGKRPYSIRLAGQLIEIPFQMLHHLRSPALPPRPAVHRFGNAWRQYQLMWLPPPERAKPMAVVIYHGGGWRLGWPGLFPTVARFFLDEGFPVFMPAYRLSPWAAYPQMREDLNLTILQIVHLLKDNGFTDCRILAGGISAGATLAAHLVLDREALSSLGLDQSIFSGLLSIAGPLDITEMPDFLAVSSYAGGKRGSPAFEKANPARLLAQDSQISAMIVHSKRDAIVPFACATSFYHKYKGPKTLHTLQRASHLGTMRFATDDLDTARTIREWMHHLPEHTIPASKTG